MILKVARLFLKIIVRIINLFLRLRIGIIKKKIPLFFMRSALMRIATLKNN
jgi:hypothetical protein